MHPHHVVITISELTRSQPQSHSGVATTHPAYLPAVIH